jgi:hypothetical protein
MWGYVYISPLQIPTFHLCSSSGSPVVAIKSKAEEIFRTTTMVFFYLTFYNYHHLNKSFLIFEELRVLLHVMSRPKLNSTSAAPKWPGGMLAMLLLLKVGNENVQHCRSLQCMTFKPTFVKIFGWFRRWKGIHKHTYMKNKMI